jgi:hypothetical protein
MDGGDAVPVRRARPVRADVGGGRAASRTGRDRQRALMALPPDVRSRGSASLPPAAADPETAPQRARAYCGAAHRVAWTLTPGGVPEHVDIPIGNRTEPYRLVRDPLTGEPARDLRGALVFVPALRADDPRADDPGPG